MPMFDPEDIALTIGRMKLYEFSTLKNEPALARLIDDIASTIARQLAPESIDLSLAERIRTTLEGSGLSSEPWKFDSSLHSWRCEYPDRYGECKCFQTLVEDLARAVTTITNQYKLEEDSGP